ncbi:hypothetical protein [Colwellia sp. 20A7]|uniref:hypothetical protein n=1 Tax=Colwellia sp. 20A7 TaxID=2689569 RepID=UPI0013577993|nr:hypothetical protein [Colwellia sp. 20A7]
MPTVSRKLKSNQLKLLDLENLPRDVFVRQQHIPAKHYFPIHTHKWHQLVYAFPDRYKLKSKLSMSVNQH